MAVVTLITLFATRGRGDAPAGLEGEAIATGLSPSQMKDMEDRPRRHPRKAHPLVRQILFLLGIVLIIVSPLVGAVPGPGGVIVFAAGLGLVLKYSGWAKRQYVRFKRRHPNKGRWADWGMRRPSARRREALHRSMAAGSVVEGGREQGQSFYPSAAPIPPRSGEE